MFLFFYHYSIIPAFHYSRISFGFWYGWFRKAPYSTGRFHHPHRPFFADWRENPLDWKAAWGYHYSKKEFHFLLSHHHLYYYQHHFDIVVLDIPEINFT